MKQKSKEIILLIIVLWVFAAILMVLSCNPVRKVLQDPEKFNVVKEEVIRRGLCANDTTIVTKSDTLVTIDTVNNYFIDTEIINDTVYLTKNIRSIATKTITIRDTIKAVVVDNARVRLLQADSATLSKESIKWKEKADKRLNWLLLAAMVVGLYLFFKYKP